jgi:hypothetical protein
MNKFLTTPRLKSIAVGTFLGTIIGIAFAHLVARPVYAQLRLPQKPPATTTPINPSGARAIIDCGTLDGQGEVSIELSDRTLVVKIKCPAPTNAQAPIFKIQKGNSV